MDLGSPFGVLDIWWVVTPKGTPSECTLSIGYIPLVCSKTFPVGSAVSGFWIRLRYKNLLNFFTTAESGARTFMAATEILEMRCILLELWFMVSVIPKNAPYLQLCICSYATL